MKISICLYFKMLHGTLKSVGEDRSKEVKKQRLEDYRDQSQEELLMKLRLFGILLIIWLVGGCASSKYGTAEKHFKKQEYGEAVRAYLKFLNPHLRDGKRLVYYDREIYTRIGIVYWYMKKYDSALQILRTVVNKDPSFGKALFYLGMSLEGLGRDDEAIDVYSKYPSVDVFDNYRRVFVGRLDWLVRKKISREIQSALNNEAQLNLADFPEKSVAVLYFLSLSDDPQWQPLQKGLAELIITDLSQIEELKVIERLRLNSLMEELNLSVTGLMDENTSPRVGKLLGTRSMIKGSYLVMPDTKMTLDAGIYQLDRVTYPKSASLEGNLSRLFQMEKNLVLRILDHFKINLTPQQRARLLKIPTENMMAFMNYCKGLDAMDRNDLLEAQRFFRQAVTFDPNFQLAQDRIMPPRMWDATHNRNSVRVSHDVTQLIKTMPMGKPTEVYHPPTLVSTLGRLQRMAAYQNAGFLPGTDSRKSIAEAELKGASVIPMLLGEPPKPPTNK